MNSRLPRLIGILIAGAALSICELVMQQLSRNCFVSPATSGTMDSARLGILITVLFFPSSFVLLKTVIAIAVSFGGTLLFMTILSRLKFKDTIFVPLVGIMFGNIISSDTSFIAYQQVAAILIPVSTALVGPLTFLGLLVMNVTFEFIRSYQHKVLIPAAMLITLVFR